MSNETELLERAVINLTLENASLKNELKGVTKDKNMWFNWYSEKDQLLGDMEKELDNLKSAQEDKHSKNKELAKQESK